jgi:hypothetical protein
VDTTRKGSREGDDVDHEASLVIRFRVSEGDRSGGKWRVQQKGIRSLIGKLQPRARCPSANMWRPDGFLPLESANRYRGVDSSSTAGNANPVNRNISESSSGLSG